MDFEFSAEHNQLRETVRRHAEEEMRPYVSEADDTERFPVSYTHLTLPTILRV